ncbi:MAG: hypothetical protein IMX01_01220 [Limnochordaceae bacterium]|nr:hypothetical protein [Limnochordaceae bacterium]
MPGLPVTWQELLAYYQAVVTHVPGGREADQSQLLSPEEAEGQNPFIWRVQDEGGRFSFYSGPDPLLGFGESNRGASSPGVVRESEARWQQLGQWAGDQFYYGYPLVVQASGAHAFFHALHILPMLYFPIRPGAAGWAIPSLRPRLNPMLWPTETEARIPLLRLLGILRRLLEGGLEPSPAMAVRTGRAIAAIAQQLGFQVAEPLDVFAWGQGLDLRLSSLQSRQEEAVSSTQPAQVYNRAALFRLPRGAWVIPDWLVLSWRDLASKGPTPFPAGLRDWSQTNREPESAGGAAGVEAETPTAAGSTSTDEPVPLLALDVLPPNERQALSDLLSRSDGLVQLPAGEAEQDVSLHLILNAWYRGRRVLVVAPSLQELQFIDHRLNELVDTPFFGVWGESDRTPQTWDKLWRWLRRGAGATSLIPAARVSLGQAWQEVQQVEQDVQRAAQAGQRYLQALSEVRRPSEDVQLPVTLARALHQAATGKAEAVQRLRTLPEPERFAACQAEAERIERGHWRWNERLWPWRRRQRALARLQAQVHELLAQAGLTPEEWLVPPTPASTLTTPLSDSPSDWVVMLRRLRATLDYGRRAGQVSVWQAQAGGGDWDSPEGMVGKLRRAFDQVVEASREAVLGRRRQELASLGEAERLQLVDFLAAEAELGQEVVAPQADSVQAMWQSLRQLEAELFELAQKAVPIWGLAVETCERPLPERTGLFDVVVVVGAERIPLGVALPHLCLGKATCLIAGTSSPGEAVWAEAGGTPLGCLQGSAVGPDVVDVHESTDRVLAARFGLIGQDYLHYRWSTSVYEWAVRQSNPVTWVRVKNSSLPLSQLREQLLLGSGGPVVGRPASSVPALRWRRVIGQEVRPEQGSAYNLEEAEAVLALVQELQGRLAGESNGGGVGQAAGEGAAAPSGWRVALVTPFSRQKEVLLRLLLERGTPSAEGLQPEQGSSQRIGVFLPHELAGVRADWVIFSPVIQSTQATPAARFLRRHPAFVEQTVKAAVQGLWVVGSPESVSALGGLWAEFVQVLKQLGTKWEPAEAADESQGRELTTGEEPAGTGLEVALDQAAASSEGSVWCERGPYPSGGEGVAAVYRELLLWQAGWQGRRELVDLSATPARVPVGQPKTR